MSFSQVLGMLKKTCLCTTPSPVSESGSGIDAHPQTAPRWPHGEPFLIPTGIMVNLTATTVKSQEGFAQPRAQPTFVRGTTGDVWNPTVTCAKRLLVQLTLIEYRCTFASLSPTSIVLCSHRVCSHCALRRHWICGSCSKHKPGVGAFCKCVPQVHNQLHPIPVPHIHHHGWGGSASIMDDKIFSSRSRHLEW